MPSLNLIRTANIISLISIAIVSRPSLSSNAFINPVNHLKRTTNIRNLSSTFQIFQMSNPSEDNSFKRARIQDENIKQSAKVIGTHSGTFQADEALGVWLLRQLPDYYKSKVVRSRDSNVLDKLDIVLDVGEFFFAVTIFERKKSSKIFFI